QRFIHALGKFRAAGVRDRAHPDRWRGFGRRTAAFALDAVQKFSRCGTGPRRCLPRLSARGLFHLRFRGDRSSRNTTAALPARELSLCFYNVNTDATSVRVSLSLRRSLCIFATKEKWSVCRTQTSPPRSGETTHVGCATSRRRKVV